MAFFEHDANTTDRFSLLLLEPGEIYLEDFSVYYYPPGKDHVKDGIDRKQRGHLKICSKSAVFVPKEKDHPILKNTFSIHDNVFNALFHLDRKIPLKHVSAIEDYYGTLYSRNASKDKTLKICTSVFVEMKKDNIISPYVFRKGSVDHVFTLNYVTVDDCLPLLCQLHRASTLPTADQNAMISAMVQSRQSRVSFNTSWLDDLYEETQLECMADKITPLVTNPGRVMVTSSRLYFQPFNNVETAPVIRVKLKDIQFMMKRRFLLKQIGIEIICGERTTQPHLYLAFKSQLERDALYDIVIAQKDVHIQTADQKDMTLKWQNGLISNYDYLMYLNSASDRSIFDLTQYPVMPWVIQDFSSHTLDLENPDTFRDLSKPIGALSADRLERMKERYQDMPEPKFLYGAHYSTPGYVLFYLARLCPEYVLCLQNGKFDQPDRMFNSLWELWQNCLQGAADFKELIPEFYDGAGEFMINTGVCNFGVRQDGRPVGDVDLPPWATCSRDFIEKMREALECDYVSRHIHNWIDLIFGYKQCGVEAEKADNVFYYMTYEGAIDLDSIKDPNERACMEIQIMEFGQVPKQLFTTPHPARFDTSGIPASLDIHAQQAEDDDDDELLPNSKEVKKPPDHMTEIAVKQKVDFTALQEISRFSLHKETITDVKLCIDKKMAFSVSQDGLLKMYSLEDQRQLRSVPLTSMALSACLVLPDNKTVICGSWDNSVYFYSVEYGSVLDSLQAHDDAVSGVCWSDNILVTASWDSSVKIWHFPVPSSQHGFNGAEFVYQLDHDYGVSNISIDEKCEILVSATKEGQLYVWDLKKYSLKSIFHVHEGRINAVKLIYEKHQIISCGEDQYLRVLDLDTGTESFLKDMKSSVLCLAAMGIHVAMGLESGQLQIWDMEKAQLVYQITAHRGPVTCLHMTEDYCILSGSVDKSVCLWRPTFR